MQREDLDELILEILEFEEFEEARYYAHNLTKPLWRMFGGNWECVPYFLRSLCDKTRCTIVKYNIKWGDILIHLAKDQSYLYVAITMINIKPESNLQQFQVMDKLCDGEDISEYIMIDENKLICGLVSYVIDNNQYRDLNFNEIYKLEKFHYDVTDYKLTKVENVEFLSGGYIYDDKYYLYSKYISKEKFEFYDKKPAIFTIIEEIENADLYMRLDERLAVPATDIISLETLDFERFRGVQFNYSNTKLERMKNIIVHQNIKSFEKLLMVIKKNYDSKLNEEFWHVEIEELPLVEVNYFKRVTVTFIHGKYYPSRKCFRHIDFIKNQYDYDIFFEKYKDMSNADVQIDHYTDKPSHYKVWCVEEADISEKVWYKLVKLSLTTIYRNLFAEILGSNSE